MAYDASRFRAYFEHEFSYYAGFARNVHRYASAVAMIDPPTGRSWTYAELGAVTDRLASALAGLGVQRGDRVLFQLFNGPEFAFCYLAAQRLGAIATPINFRLAAGEVAHVLADSTPRVFIYDQAVAEVASAALAASDSTVAAVIVGDDQAGSARRFEELLEQASGDLPEFPSDFSIYEETTRLYTSGTTGLPKGVSLPSIVEVMSAHDVIMHFPLAPEDRTLNMTPWFHRGGLYSGGPNPVFYVGGSVVPLRAFDPATTLDWVQEYQLTYLIGAPTTLAMLANEQERAPRDLDTLRGIVTMGAPLERQAALRFQELLTERIFNGYGTTEAFWNTFLRPSDLPGRAGTAGRACTDDDVAVVKIFEDRRARPDEVVAKDGVEIGEIIMRSPKAGLAYVNAPQEEADKFVDGWMYPGDLAVWDGEEFVTIVGRKDDMIISGGENVHPVQVEEALSAHPGVADSVVVGLPDDHWGQRVVAYVIRKDPAVSAADLEQHLLASPQLSNFKRPRAYCFVTEVPMTATGKKMHYKLAEQAVRDHQAGLFESP